MTYLPDETHYTIFWWGDEKKPPSVWANLARPNAAELQLPEAPKFPAKNPLTETQVIAAMILVHFTGGNVEVACALMNDLEPRIGRFDGHRTQFFGRDLFRWIVEQWVYCPVIGLEYFPDHEDALRAGPVAVEIAEARHGKMPPKIRFGGAR